MPETEDGTLALSKKLPLCRGSTRVVTIRTSLRIMWRRCMKGASRRSVDMS